MKGYKENRKDVGIGSWEKKREGARMKKKMRHLRIPLIKRYHIAVSLVSNCYFRIQSVVLECG